MGVCPGQDRTAVIMVDAKTTTMTTVFAQSLLSPTAPPEGGHDGELGLLWEVAGLRVHGDLTLAVRIAWR